MADCQHRWRCQVSSELNEITSDVPARYVACCELCEMTIMTWHEDHFWAMLGESENTKLHDAVKRTRLGEKVDWLAPQSVWGIFVGKGNFHLPLSE